METSEDALCLLVEILSCSNLLIRDKRAKSSDPYVKVKLNGKDIHQTKSILKTLNPTFGDAQNNSFLLDCSAKDLFDHQGLLFKVKDWNRLSPDQDLGTIQVPPMDLYKATGEPLRYALVAPSDFVSPQKGTDAGSITLRCWPATEAHLEKFGREKSGLRGFVSGIQSHAKESMAHIKQDVREVSQKFHDKSPFKGNSNNNNNNKVESEEAGPAETTTTAAIATTTTAPKERTIESLGADSDPDALEEEQEKPAASQQAQQAAVHIMDRRKIVVEVVAGRDLLVSDFHSSDPYVRVMLGEKEVHKTKHLTKTLNPVFTPELNSTFILECTDATLSDKNGLKFAIKDYDLLGKDEEMGTVDVAYTTLVKGNGDAMEFMVTPPKGETKEAGYLLVRFRDATPEDEKAMQDKKHKKNLFGPTTKEAVSAAWGLLGDIQKKKKTEEEPVPESKADTPRAAAVEYVVQAESAESNVQPEPGEELHLKIEIVSCRGLLAADKNGLSDPYVKIILADKDLHKTKHILKTLNPIFADNDNVYTLHCPASELFDAGGLTFRVKDWDRIGKNDNLGEVAVPAAKIYSNMHGDDLEFRIAPPKGKENDDAGYLTIRCSSTTADDHTGEKKKFLGLTKPDIKVNVPKIKPVAELFQGSKERGLNIDENEEPLPMFVQVVSCRDLLVADKSGSSDPYVKIKMGKKDLHETKHLDQTLNPTFSSQHNPFFVLDARPSEVRANGGLTFKVKDYDRVGSNDELGTATLDADTLYASEGASLELKIDPPKGVGEAAGFITIRCRPATQSDRIATNKSMFGGFQKKMSVTNYGEVDLHLLIEVVSGWQLPIADMNSSDPYVKVKIGPRGVHETKPIKNTRDPIYTIKHNSIFILDVATKELTENEGMLFKVKDFDMLGRNDDLGEVFVPAETILKANGERLELQLKHGEKDAGFLAIRIRPATNYDREFLKQLKSRDNKSDFLGLNRSYQMTMKTKGGTGNRLKAIMTKMVKEEDGVKKFRVRPYPDPERPEETEFMSEDHIEKEAFKPSKKWLDVGSGDLGKIYVEILGADGLPNKDRDLGGGNKTDSFVSLIFEDCIAKTDVIDDCLSPRWLPWMQRAFIFRMMHTSSNINIGVFDYDPGFGQDHDICGRVSIDLANFQPNTEYVLRYKLYENAVMENRTPKGIIMLRLRMELKKEKDLILSNITMPPEFYLNVKNSKDFDLVRQTIGGRQNLDAYSQKTIMLYVEELMGYQVLKYYLADSFMAILFWRGQVRVYGFWLPLHSLALFVAGITLAERPSLFPSYFFFGIAWALLSVQTWRNNSSNPWHKTKTFLGLTQQLLTGFSFDGPPNRIAAHQNEEAAKAEEKAQMERIEKAKQEAEEYNKAQFALMEEHNSMMAQVGDQTADTDISTQKGGGLSLSAIDPLKFVLYPIQGHLKTTCTILRGVKNVLIWDEPYIAFLLTLATFAIGVVFLFVPWAFIIRWTSRILAWLLLGPHMKLVDVFWYSKFEDLTKEQRRERIQAGLAQQLEIARKYASDARVLRENAIKMKDIKQELYGNFITKVPVLRVERFPDVPLHSSTATPYVPPKNQPPIVPERIPGQHLVGTMIPRIQDNADTFEVEAEGDEEAKKKD